MTSQPLNALRMMICGLCAISILSACNQGGSDNSAAADGTATGIVQPAGESDDSGKRRYLRSDPVVAETLAYAEIGDQLAKGHFVIPEDMVEPSPAIILIHEWFGLDENMRQLADRLAGQGFIVLAVDLYQGRTATNPGDARDLMLEVFENPEIAEANIVGAVDWVLAATGASQVATVGYGLGGGWSLNAAMALGDRLDGAVIFYGQVTDNEESLAAIQTPVLGFFGSEDSTIPVATVLEFDTALENLNKEYTIKIFEGAKGGFASTGNRNFNLAQSDEAWEMMIDFLLLEFSTISVDAE